jgi:LPS-assembly protein
VTRRLATALAALAAARAFGAPAPSATDAAPNLASPVITSDETNVDFDGTGDFIGHARWTQAQLLLTADQMHFDRSTNTLIARGHVTLTNRDQRMLADYLEYRRNLGTFLARDVRIGRYPLYIQGETADGREDEMTIHNAIVTYTDPGAWKPSIKAKTIVYSPGHYLRSVRSLVGVNGAEVVPIGTFRDNLNSALHADLLTFEFGYRSSLGGIATVGAHIPVGDGFRIGGDISEYTKRGIMMGPSGTYADPDGSNDWHGSFTSGFIDDHGDRLTDVLGNQIPSEREFATWQHVQNIGTDWTITGEANYWSDSDVTRDFRPKEFLPVQTPDTYLDAIHFGDNDFAEIFARFRPNNFEDVQERLPEISYDLAPLAIGGGFYERGSASAVMLKELPPVVTPVAQLTLGGPEVATGPPAPLGPNLSDTRLDAYYSISRPFNPTSWFNFTPIAGGRLTEYLDTQGAVTDGHYLRTLGEIGFDSEARASGVYDYQNLNWDIDGIRHLIVPQISYRYIPGSESGNPHIPDIDAQTFSPYLQPLELGDASAVDELGRRNTLRLGIDNIFQTREAGYGSRDLLNLNIADDINFTRTPLEPDISDLHSELTITPAKWLEFEAANVVNPETFTLREIDAGISLKDGNVWSLRLATDFYRHEDHDYSANYSLRLTETLTGIVLVQYSARQNVFDELAVGITQNLGNVWSVQYLITDNGGPNREGRLDVRVSLLMLKF